MIREGGIILGHSFYMQTGLTWLTSWACKKSSFGAELNRDHKGNGVRDLLDSEYRVDNKWAVDSETIYPLKGIFLANVR